MRQYNCIVVEDEPLAAEVIQDYIKQIPFLVLKAVCQDAIYAIDILQKEKVDLIFLDIHLPKLKGLDFIRTISNPPHIIITTAYHEYALQGYEHNVVDYLLKPIEFSRFLGAVNKVVAINAGKESEIKSIHTADDYLFFNVNKKKVRIFLSEILVIESLKEYIRIVTKDKTIITKFQLGQIDVILSKSNFIRVHRSYIVAKDKIDAFTSTDVEVNNILIPIGRAYRELVIESLDKRLVDR